MLIPSAKPLAFNLDCDWVCLHHDTPSCLHLKVSLKKHGFRVGSSHQCPTPHRHAAHTIHTCTSVLKLGHALKEPPPGAGRPALTCSSAGKAVRACRSCKSCCAYSLLQEEVERLKAFHTKEDDSRLCASTFGYFGLILL